MKHSKHNLNYVDLYLVPVKPEPAGWIIWLGAALTLAAVYIVILLSVLF